MKKGLMQTDPMTGMPVAQPGSTPMFPVSQGVNGGSMARFNPMINQYAQANPLANAAYASQPMPALAQQSYIKKIERQLLPKQGAIGTLAPTKGVKTEVIEPTMEMKKVLKPVEPKKDTVVNKPTISYGQMAIGRKALNQQKKDAAQVVTQDIGPSIISGAANLITGVPIAKAAYEIGSAASNVLSKIRKGAGEHFEEKTALKQKPIPKGSGLEDLVESGPKGKAAVENMGYETNALARMKGNGMYKKNCGYKK